MNLGTQTALTWTGSAVRKFYIPLPGFADRDRQTGLSQALPNALTVDAVESRGRTSPKYWGHKKTYCCSVFDDFETKRVHSNGEFDNGDVYLYIVFSFSCYALI